MRPGLSRRTATFVVRIWTEYLEQAPPAWRGEIEEVGTGERMAFRDVAEMVRYVQAHLPAGRAWDGEGER